MARLTTGASAAPFDPTRVTQLSWRPRAFIYRGFLTDEECDHLITLAKDKLEKSMVADNESGNSVESEVRTSSGMFLKKAQDDVVAGIEVRIAAWTFLPEENGESIQILHYDHGQKYEPHFDYFNDKINQERGGNRVATVLMYLSNIEKGGETIFPSSEAKGAQPKGDDWSDCAKNGYAVKPKKSDALLFFSLNPDATTDPLRVKSGLQRSGFIPPCCDKANVKRGPWTAEEDAKILAYVASHGIGNWTLVPQKAGLNRCGKSCRLRWTNYLRPDLKHDYFTPREEELILELHKAIGSRWSLIAKQLPGRTDNDVKNYWNTKLRKKLSKMGIDPVTHKPFSQILTDYGNISGLPNTRNSIGSLSYSPTNRSVPKAEPYLVPTELLDTQMINSPIIEQFQATPVTNNSSWGNVAPFPVINQETVFPHFFNEVPSSASSSSSCGITQLSSPQSFSCQTYRVQMVPPSPPSWTEFILGEPSESTDIEQQKEHEFQGMLSSKNDEVTMQNETFPYNFGNGNGNNSNGITHGKDGYDERNNGSHRRNCSEATPSAVDSFVDGILDLDSKMQLEFPLLLDGYSDS
ncbi:unnamed protein product [Ilex paraguariensis]|uniref:procollagen-proline 4-dioxygenase n=1 Tax=Ilex paraguariensis TaxID=185542 RepID=A0ABC8T447_9AQUA